MNGLWATVNTATPGQGAVLQAGYDATLAQLSQIGSPAELPLDSFETHCRGNDLITRYQATDDNPIAYEIYWRRNGLEDWDADRDGMTLETIYSLQTDLLDSSPQPIVPSTFTDATLRWFRCGTDNAWEECEWDDAMAVVIDTQPVACIVHVDETALLQTVLPADLKAIELSTMNDQTEVQWHLRSEFLEKGVIRRLRMLTVIGATDSGDEALLDAAHRFYRSELPLTV
jgi:hypothetical protein